MLISTESETVATTSSVLMLGLPLRGVPSLKYLRIRYVRYLGARNRKA